jgi:hypothetical protein
MRFINLLLISHSQTSEDPEFRNLADFQEEDPTFFDFPETQQGGFGPFQSPETNSPFTSIPSPRFNFTFGGSMVANQTWLTINSLAIPRPENTLPQHPEKLLPMLIPTMIYYLKTISISLSSL